MSTRERWAGDLGRKWAEMADAQDALLGAFQETAIAALGALEGRRILDLGCGQGTSSFALADAGAAEVVGLDVSPDLLAVATARKEAGAPGADRVRFALGDAAEATFHDDFDGLFSRFGAMFFDAPVPAWTNLRAAMRPGARLAVVAWRSIKENDWAGLPLRLTADLLPKPEPLKRGAPGPFGWADPDFFAPMLEAAGWKDVAWRAEDRDLALEAGDAADPVARAVEHALEIGPTSSRLAEAPEAEAEVRARLEEGFAAHVRDGAVRLRGAVWVVTARA